MKNANGTGSIIKLSGNRRRPYAVKITTGYTIDGKQTRKIIGYYTNRKDALNCLLEYNQNKNVYLNDVTFKQCYEMWSKEHFNKISIESAKVFKDAYNNIISLNDYKIKDIKLNFLQDTINKLKDEGLNGKLKQIKSLLNSVFNYALKNEYINKNIVRFLELGKIEKVIERKVFTFEEIEKLWRNKGDIITDIVLILIYTGLRVNELLKLENSKINLEERYIKTGSKTKAGKNRLIPINYKILPIITSYMKLNNKFLFQTRNGNNLIYSNFRKKFKEKLTELGIQEHTVHDTRHTFATLMSNADANPVSIKLLTGHNDYDRMTAKVYTHKDINELKKAIDLL